MIEVQVVTGLWDEIKWILEFIVAVGNLIVVIYIFTKDKTRYKEEYNMQTYSYWFHSLLLKDSLESINNFFDEYNRIMNSTENLRQKSEKIANINTLFDIQVIDVAEIINGDLAKFLSDKTEELRDYICGRLDNIESQPACRTSIIVQSIEQLTIVKNEILKELYKVDLKKSPYSK